MCSFSKLSKPFWKIINASYSKLSEALKNGIEMSVDQAVFQLTVKMLFGSITQELLGLPRFWCYFWVPWTIYYKMHILFFKKVLIILRKCSAHNMPISDQYPLNTFGIIWGGAKQGQAKNIGESKSPCPPVVPPLGLFCLNIFIWGALKKNIGTWRKIHNDLTCGKKQIFSLITYFMYVY